MLHEIETATATATIINTARLQIWCRKEQNCGIYCKLKLLLVSHPIVSESARLSARCGPAGTSPSVISFSLRVLFRGCLRIVGDVNNDVGQVDHPPHVDLVDIFWVPAEPL